MKNSLILLLLISSILFASELSWVDEQVDAIKPNRNGVSNTKISKLKNPFVYLKKNLTKKHKPSKTKHSTPTHTLVQSNPVSNLSTNSKIKSSPLITSITTSNSVLTLSAIINSSALINGEWYKSGDTLHRYKLVKVGKTSVTLLKNNNKTVLSTKTSANKLKFK